MGKVTYIIKLSIADAELEKIYTELGDAEPTEENITATPTFRRIMDRLYAQMVKTDEENKNAEAANAKPANFEEDDEIVETEDSSDEE